MLWFSTTLLSFPAAVKSKGHHAVCSQRVREHPLRAGTGSPTCPSSILPCWPWAQPYYPVAATGGGPTSTHTHSSPGAESLDRSSSELLHHPPTQVTEPAEKWEHKRKKRAKSNTNKSQRNSLLASRSQGWSRVIDPTAPPNPSPASPEEPDPPAATQRHCWSGRSRR